jgi:glutaredoxin
MIQKLTERECRDAITKGGFEPLPGTGALILTQSWCPQWKAMKNYLDEAEQAGKLTADIRYIEYDLESFFEEFMLFKEDTYNNREIPYVRYYHDGAFTGESNYISQEGFLYRLFSD